MRTVMYDGGIHNRPKPAPPPPPPPAPRRTGSADRMEREAETPPRAAQAPASPAPLRAAARATEAKVDAAEAARANADAMQALPPAAQPALRAEIQQAELDASRAEAAAERAAAAEIDVARIVLSPAYFERYVDDLQADQRHPAVQRAVHTARHPPPPPDPLEARIDDALRAQAEADRLLQHGRPSESYLEHVVVPARERASEAWAAVEAEAQADLLRTQELRDVRGGRGPTADERAQALIARAPGRPELAEAIGNALTRNSGNAIAADVERVFAGQGADAAAKRLDTLTAGNRPEVARDALLALGPTLDAIGADLGARAGAADVRTQTRGPAALGPQPQDRYDEAVMHLSNASYLASLADGGDDAAQTVADALARHVDPRNIGRLDEALGKAVRSTGAATLALGVADALQRDIQRAGSERKSNQADDVLQNVEAGLQGLMEDTEAAAAKLADDPVFRLIAGYSQIRVPGADPAAALKAHLDAHPDEAEAYQAALADLDRQGLAALRAAESLRERPASLAGLEHGRKLAERHAEFEDDDTVAFAIASSEGAGRHLDLMVTAAGGDDPALIDTLAAGTGVAKSVQEAVGRLWIKRTLGQAYGQVSEGRIDEASATLDRLKGHGRFFGVNGAKIDAAVDELKAVVQASGAAGVTPEQLAAQARQLDQKLEDLGFDADTAVGKSFRMLGVSLSLVGAGQSTYAALTGGTEPGEVFDAVVAGAGLSKDAVEVLRKDAEFLEGARWRAYGTTLAGIGVAIDVLAFGGHASEGDKSRAALDAASAIGGGLGIWATATSGAALGGWAGPVGLGLVALAALGRLGHDQWDRVQDANRLENEATQAYLQAMGFDKAVTYHLRNADSEGRSALPALAAMAESYGYDFSDPADAEAFVAYINGFAARSGGLDQLGELVEAAHHVNRTDDGSFEQALTSQERWASVPNGRYNPDGVLAASRIDSLAGLRLWMDTQAAEGNGFTPPPPR